MPDHLNLPAQSQR